MGYIEKNLIAGEKILYRTRLHSVAVLFPLLVGVVVAVSYTHLDVYKRQPVL